MYNVVFDLFARRFRYTVLALIQLSAVRSAPTDPLSRFQTFFEFLRNLIISYDLCYGSVEK